MTRTDHFKMLYDIGELSHLFVVSKNLHAFLYEIVELVSKHMRVNVCSIYIYDDMHNDLTLKANKGLVDIQNTNLKISLNENIIGKSLEKLKPISLKHMTEHADYSRFPQLFQKGCDSFLAMPIHQGMNRVGVLVVQREGDRPFTRNDMASLKVLASQLGNIISNVKILMTLKPEPKDITNPDLAHKLHFIKGKSASTGYALSKSMSLRKEENLAHFSQLEFSKIFTLDEFRASVLKTEEQLEKLQQSVEEKLSDAASLIFTAHLLMLKDRDFIENIVSNIKKGANPPDAILETGKKFIDLFSASSSPIIREKQEDMRDIMTRLLYNLIYDKPPIEKYQNQIIIAKELYPSDILKMSAKNVAGIILLSGGVTSHVAILAKSLNIPMVIIDKPELMEIPDGTTILIDAELGHVYLEPSEKVKKQLEENKQTYLRMLNDKELLGKEALTNDGEKIYLLANINLISDLYAAVKNNCDGIGLYRTEFPFLIRPDFPSEEEQYIIYKKIVDGMAGKPITFRTLDVGGDKLISYYNFNEKNPSLGFRSTRFTLQHKDIFEEQIRAILRAGCDADLRIMFPMISSIEEFLEAKNVLLQCQQELNEEKIPYHDHPKLGIMIEIPSIIDLIDDIAKELDFFSIGTNDLIQFLLAVDRGNEKIASFYNPWHPSVTRNLKTIVESATRNNIDVSICGDVAHDEQYIPFLLGIGLRRLSVNPVHVLKVKKRIAEINITQAEEMAKNILSKSRLFDIKQAISFNH